MRLDKELLRKEEPSGNCELNSYWSLQRLGRCFHFNLPEKTDLPVPSGHSLEILERNRANLPLE